MTLLLDRINKLPVTHQPVNVWENKKYKPYIIKLVSLDEVLSLIKEHEALSLIKELENEVLSQNLKE